jgi:hypothetical protein
MVLRDRRNFIVQKPQLGAPRFLWEKFIGIRSKKNGQNIFTGFLRKCNGGYWTRESFTQKREI